MSIKFGVFADLHYSLPNTEERGNSGRTFEDMQKGMERFEAAGTDFAVSLGDNIQPAKNAAEQYAQFKAMTRKWGNYGFPVHAAFGNHEFSQLSLSEVLEILQTDRTYYSFDLGNVRFVILDSNYSPDGTHYSADNFDWRYGCISEEQVAWLEKILSDKTRTFLFIHNNIYFDPAEEYSEWYQIVNHAELRGLLKASGCVEAVFQGHDHTFRNTLADGIRFVNIPSPERSAEYTESDFPIIEILENGFLYNSSVL